MRPIRDLLLLMRDENELGRWRFVLETRGISSVWRYRLHATCCLLNAVTMLRSLPDDALVATNIPGELGADALAIAGGARKVLLFGIPYAPKMTLANRVECEGPVLAGRVLDSLRILGIGKRGRKMPTPEPRRAMLRDLSFESHASLRALEDEREVRVA